MTKHRARSRVRRERPDRREHQERRELRREELLAAAAEAVRQHGPGVSMEQMAAAAGVTKPILYRHVGGRREVAEALSEQFIGSLAGDLDAALAGPGEPRELLVNAIDAYLATVERDRNMYSFLVRALAEDPGAHQMLTGVMQDLAARVALVVGERLRAVGLDSGAAEPWALGLVGMVHAAGDWWLDHKTMPRARLVEYLAQLVWDGLDRSLGGRTDA